MRYFEKSEDLKEILEFLKNNFNMLNLNVEVSFKEKNNKFNGDRFVIYSNNVKKNKEKWIKLLHFLSEKYGFKLDKLNLFYNSFLDLKKHGVGIEKKKEKVIIKYYVFLNKKSDQKFEFEIFERFKKHETVKQHINESLKIKGRLVILGLEFDCFGEVKSVKKYCVFLTNNFYCKLSQFKRKIFQKKINDNFKKIIPSYLYFMEEFSDKNKQGDAIHLSAKFSDKNRKKSYSDLTYSYLGFYFNSEEVNYYYNLKLDKVLIIYPPSSNANNFFPIPPLSLANLKGYLSKNKVISESVDLEAYVWKFKYDKSADIKMNLLFENVDEIFSKNFSLEVNKIVEFLVKISEGKKYDVICFSIMGVESLISSLFISKFLKKHYGKKIIFGGYYPSSFSEILENFDFIDYIFIGRSEHELLELIKNNFISEKRTINGKKIIETTPVFNENQLGIYRDSVYHNSKKHILILPYELTFGCINNCSFCAYKKYSAFKLKSEKQIFEDLNYFKTNFSSKFFFYDSAINLNNEIFLKIMGIFKKLKSIEYSCYAIPDISKKDAYLMKETGCVNVRMAIECTNEENLKILNKPVKSLETIEKSILNLFERGIKPNLLFISNFPEKTKKDIDNDIGFIKKFKDKISGVSIYKYALHKNSDDFKKYNPNKPLISNNFPVDDFTKIDFRYNDLYSYYIKKLKDIKIELIEYECNDNLGSHLMKFYSKFYSN